jgi:hypothetical protein
MSATGTRGERPRPHRCGKSRGPYRGLLAALAVLAASISGAVAEDAVLKRQAAEYSAETPKTILELQQFRQTAETPIRGASGLLGTARLVNLSPRINGWYLLTLDRGKSGGTAYYHLENPAPASQTLQLAADGVDIVSGPSAVHCSLWSDANQSALETARHSGLPYAPLCAGRLYLRNPVSGSQTNLELTTDFLRDHVWGGEKLVGYTRQLFYRDVFLQRGTSGLAAGKQEPVPDPNAPRPAQLDPARMNAAVVPTDLGIDLGRPVGTLLPGRWYPAAGEAGIYFSFVQPQTVSASILSSHRDHVNDLDGVESVALDYLVAFDLARFDIGFALGTDHPRVDWSDRPPDTARRALPGPDGIAHRAPLVTNGMLSPSLVPSAIATFAGGFKRRHGAFKWGAFAQINHGSHYGFIEQGVVFSKLQPGLATVYVLDDSSIGMKSWSEEDNVLLDRIRFARQNGVSLIEQDAATGGPMPGPLVNQWGPGNWSGTADEQLRSVRSALCLAETASRRFLVFGYFSAATPSAMARVLQAYGCRYALHLDMNALEHTYLALYFHKDAQIAIQHLVGGMAGIDKKSGAAMAPRFLAYPDDRDFFYLTRKATGR